MTTALRLAPLVLAALFAAALTSVGAWAAAGEGAGERPSEAEIGSIQVLVASHGTYDWLDEQYRSMGLDPAAAYFIVAKNPMNYRRAYGDIARAFLVLDTPGPTPATLRHVQFKKLERPYFPLDEEIPGLEPTILS